MTALGVLSSAGPGIEVTEAALEAFRGGFRGPVILAGDAGYEEARRVWNGNIDRRPAIIARCTGVADVQAAVNFARENNVVVAVRGGAHNAAGNGTCDGGIVIDLSLMKGIRVDPASRTARAEGGVLWGEFDRECQVYGLATTGGTVSNTGIAGLTLGGGIGWLMGMHGLTCDNLLSVDLVTAAGEPIQANATQNEDLFWAVRGGGGNFGIVTSFEYQVHPVGPMVLGGTVIHLLEHAPDVLRFYREFCQTLPDEAMAGAAILTAPGGPPVCAMILGWSGPDLAAGERALAPARAFGQPIQDTIGPISYCARQGLLDEPNAVVGLQRYWKSGYSTDLNDGLIATLAQAGATFSSPMSAMLMIRVSGQATRIPAGETAFGLRQAQWDLNVVAQWEDPTETVHTAWAKELWSRIEPQIAPSTYLNHLAGDDSPERVRASYGPSYTRLSQIKRQYDPTNLFRLNANIEPA